MSPTRRSRPPVEQEDDSEFREQPVEEPEEAEAGEESNDESQSIDESHPDAAAFAEEEEEEEEEEEDAPEEEPQPPAKKAAEPPRDARPPKAWTGACPGKLKRAASEHDGPRPWPKEPPTKNPPPGGPQPRRGRARSLVRFTEEKAAPTTRYPAGRIPRTPPSPDPDRRPRARSRPRRHSFPPETTPQPPPGPPPARTAPPAARPMAGLPLQPPPQRAAQTVYSTPGYSTPSWHAQQMAWRGYAYNADTRQWVAAPGHGHPGASSSSTAWLGHDRQWPPQDQAPAPPLLPPRLQPPPAPLSPPPLPKPYVEKTARTSKRDPARTRGGQKRQAWAKKHGVSAAKFVNATPPKLF